MKYFFITISILFLSCNSIRPSIAKVSLCEINQVLLQNEPKLNLKKYSDLPYKKDSISIRYEVKKNSKGYFSYKKIKKLNLTKSINYNSRGQIIWAKLSYDFGNEEIGIETHYDNQGNIAKTIDHEKGYNICYAQAIEIVKQKLKNKISKYDAVEFVLQRVDLNEFPNKKPVWSVGIVPEPDDAIGETTYYKIDGVTGKYLGKYTVGTVHN